MALTALIAAFVLQAALAPFASAEPSKKLAPLAPFVGKTWKTSSVNPDGTNGFTDVTRWEWIMKGQAIRILHSVNGGSYGGESLIHYDPSTEHIIYRYVTTAGFYTNGVITITDEGFTVEEDVVGLPDVIGVRAGYMIRDGKMETWSQFINRDGEGPINRATYEESPDADYNVDQ